MDDNLKSFIQDHRINVLDTNKRAYRHTRMNTRFFQYSQDYNMMTATESLQYETERLYTVEISEGELTRIADFEAKVFNNMRDHGHYNMFETLMKQKEQERTLRDKYPAVKKAYEHYSLILKLAESGEL
jgi:DNA repair ATPase RecN